MLRGGRLQPREFRVELRRALLGGSAQLGKRLGRAVPAAAQVRQFCGEAGGPLLGGESRLGEFGELRRLPRRGLLVARRSGRAIGGPLLRGGQAGARLLALALQFAHPVTLAVQQLLRTAQLGRQRLELLLELPLLLGPQLRQRRPGVGGAVRLLGGRGRGHGRWIQHRQLGCRFQIGVSGGRRRRRERTRTHRFPGKFP